MQKVNLNFMEKDGREEMRNILVTALSEAAFPKMIIKKFAESEEEAWEIIEYREKMLEGFWGVHSLILFNRNKDEVSPGDATRARIEFKRFLDNHTKIMEKLKESAEKVYNR